MSTLEGKRLLITGASRGIGEAIALRAARDGARIAIVAKTEAPHPKLPGTIHSVASQVEALGGQAVPIACDLRFQDQIDSAVALAVDRLGGLDILVNNASAIFLAGTTDTPIERFDLMHGVNVRATFAMGRAAIPHLAEGRDPHILTLSPPLDLSPRWFAAHLAYTMSKYGMSMCTLGWSAELLPQGIAASSLWPRTVIDTAALRLLEGFVDRNRARRPEIVAEAAHAILTDRPRRRNGELLIDEDVLRETGVDDFSEYAVDPELEPQIDLFLDET
ncbi:MAG: NAD(P)-dependent oxidoreductase [Planctomycetota bacterium]